MSAWARRTRPVFLLVLFLAVSPRHLWAQSLPVETGSQIPVALWFAGAGILGLVLIYGILHNRRAREGRPRKRSRTARDGDGQSASGAGQGCAPTYEEGLGDPGRGRGYRKALARRGRPVGKRKRAAAGRGPTGTGVGRQGRINHCDSSRKKNR